MKRSILISLLAMAIVLSSCKDGTNIFKGSKEKNQKIERLEKENQALRRELEQIEETHQDDITNIREDYEQTLAELQKKIEQGTVAEYDAYYVVVGSFKNEKYARSYSEKIKQMGHEGKIVPGPDNFNLVTSGTYDRLNIALNKMKEAREKIASKSWVYYRK
ncbi:MAG: SPOR domain-containing protein [Bacteroidota bacterium]